MNELVLHCAALAAAPDQVELLHHLLGKVLLPKLLRGLLGGQFQFAEKGRNVALVVLRDGVGATIKLAEDERVVATLLHKKRIGAEDAVVEIRLMDLGVEVAGGQHELGNLGTFGIPLLRPVAVHAAGRLIDKPP